jgi:hypothetical protein
LGSGLLLGLEVGRRSAISLVGILGSKMNLRSEFARHWNGSTETDTAGANKYLAWKEQTQLLHVESHTNSDLLVKPRSLLSWLHTHHYMEQYYQPTVSRLAEMPSAPPR